MAKANPFRFSTKYQDDETDLIYYGYRYYNPSTGCWLGRDPIQEKGGINLYCFLNNDSENAFDILGNSNFNDPEGPAHDPYNPFPTFPKPPSNVLDGESLAQQALDMFRNYTEGSFELGVEIPFPVPPPWQASFSATIAKVHICCRNQITRDCVKGEAKVKGGIGKKFPLKPSKKPPKTPKPEPEPAGGGSIVTQPGAKCPGLGWSGELDIGVYGEAALLIGVKIETYAAWDLPISGKPSWETQYGFTAGAGVEAGLFIKINAQYCE